MAASAQHPRKREIFQETGDSRTHFVSTPTDTRGVKYTRVGCYKNIYGHKGADASIPSMEGHSSYLDGRGHQRTNAIYKCYQAAYQFQSYKVFALDYRGFCRSGPEAHLTYDKYGKSDGCPADGKGANGAIDVYRLVYKDYYMYGCFKDVASSRAIPDLEGTDSMLDGDYKTRQDAVKKCYQVAKKRGFKMFAVQDGQCFSGPYALYTYSKYRRSSDCKSDGRGAPNANEVYKIAG